MVDTRREEVGEGWAGEIVDHWVQHAVHVGKAEGGEEGQVRRGVDLTVPHVVSVEKPEDADPHSHAGQEANHEHDSHHHDEVDGPLDLGMSVHLSLP